MRRGLVVLFLASWPLALHAADPATAATQAARELTQTWRAKNKAPLTQLMMAPLKYKSGDAAAMTFTSELMRALLREKVNVVDEKSVKAAIEEAAVGMASDAVLSDMAGAFGAKAVLVGSVDALGATDDANLRLVTVPLGTLAAAVKVSFDGGATTNHAAVESATLEVQLRRLADKLAGDFDGLEGEARYQQFAVLNFDEVGANAKDRQLGTLVASELTTKLVRDRGLLMVERAALAKVIDEMALGQSGLVDPEKAAEVGRLAGAQALVLGSVADAGDRYLVNARVVDVTSGKIVAAEDTHLPAADLVALSSDAVVLRSTSGAVYRSILLPGWGQFYNREPTKGTLFVVGEVASAALAGVFHFMGTEAQSRYHKLTPQDSVAQWDKVHDQAETDFKRRNIFIYTLIGLHALNILDAFINGQTYSVGGSTGGG